MRAHGMHATLRPDAKPIRRDAADWTASKYKQDDDAFVSAVMREVARGTECCATTPSTENGTRFPVHYSPDRPPLP
jgi:hypothetical protein